MIKKFVSSTLAAASILGTSAVAYADLYVPACDVFWNGYYWFWNGYDWVRVCS